MSDTPKHILQTVQTSERLFTSGTKWSISIEKSFLRSYHHFCQPRNSPPLADKLPWAQQPSTGPEPQLADCSPCPNTPFPQHPSCYTLHSHLISSTQPYRLLFCTSQLQAHYLVTAEAQVSILDQMMWDLWWTHWHWDSCLFSKYVGFPPSVSFHQCYTFIFHLPTTDAT